MTDKYDLIFNVYKKYIEDNSQYSARVVKYNTNTSTYFPLIVFTQSNAIDTNNSMYNIDEFEELYFTINIYTQNKVKGSQMVAAQVIDSELRQLTIKFFKNLNMKKTLDSPTPNIDENVLRRTIQYQCEVNNRFNIIRR